VRENCRRLRLAREPRPDGWIIRQLGRENLDGDRTVEAQVACAINDRHAATPDLVLEVVLVSDRRDDAIVEWLAHAIRSAAAIDDVTRAPPF
jgi:hypothetical protein